jgi:hypothetical protein
MNSSIVNEARHMLKAGVWGTMGVGINRVVSGLLAELDRAKRKVDAWDELQASTDRICERLEANGVELRADPDAWDCRECGSAASQHQTVYMWRRPATESNSKEERA